MDRTISESGLTTAKAPSDHSPLGAFVAKLRYFMTRKSPWSFAEQRLLIELARASKSLDEAVEVTGRKPESVKKMAMRLCISFKPNATEG